VDNIQSDIDEMLKGKKKLGKKRINSYRKGSTFERKISSMLTEDMGVDIARVPMSGAFGTTHNSDLVSGDLFCPKKGIFQPFCFECKHHNKENLILDVLNRSKKTNPLLEWVQQCNEDSFRCGKIPIVIFRLNRSQIFCVFPFEYQNVKIKPNHEMLTNRVIKLHSYLKDQTLRVIFFFLGHPQIITPYSNFEINKLYTDLKDGKERQNI